jgi:hypothetical protein
VTWTRRAASAPKLYCRHAGTRGGRVIFIGGPPESGRSDVLSHVAEVVLRDVPTVRVLQGRFVDGDYASMRPAETNVARGVDDLLAAVVKEAVKPVSGFLAEILAGLGPAWREVKRLKEHRRHLTIDELTPHLLRCEAAEHPVVCLIDDFDAACGEWFDSLLFTFAQEINDELPVAFAAAVDGPALLPPYAHDEPSVWSLARSLRARGLADWCGLRPINDRELMLWLGPMETSLVESLRDITGGRSGAVADTWSQWRLAGLVELGEDDLWAATHGSAPLLAAAADSFGSRVTTLLRREGPGWADAVREVLGCGALEGRTFTVDAVWAALTDCRQRDFACELDDLIDVLDGSLVSGHGDVAGLLIEHDPLTLVDSAGAERHVCCYSFRDSLDWRIARWRLLRGPERHALASHLADALGRLYPLTPAVAPRIARMLLEVGEVSAAGRYQAVARAGQSHALVRSQARILLGADMDDALHEQLRWAAGILIHACSELTGVDPNAFILRLARRAHALAVRAHADPERAGALAWMAISSVTEPEDADDRSAALEALQLCISGRGRPEIHAAVVRVLGDHDAAEGAPGAARARYSDALRRCRALQDSDAQAEIRSRLAGLELDLGNLAAARRHAESGCQLARTPFREVFASADLADVLRAEERPSAARKVLVGMLRLCDEHELSFLEALARLRLLRLEGEEGNLVAVQGHLARLGQLIRDGLVPATHLDWAAVEHGIFKLRFGDTGEGRAELAALDTTGWPFGRNLRLRIATCEQQRGDSEAARAQLQQVLVLADSSMDEEVVRAILTSALDVARRHGHRDVERAALDRLDRF